MRIDDRVKTANGLTSKTRASWPSTSKSPIKNSYGISGAKKLGELLESLPDDEVFTTGDIIQKMGMEAMQLGGRVRDWIHLYPGNYVRVPRGLVIGSRVAIEEFCKFHSFSNPWQR